MTREIQWGIRDPEPENPDDIEHVTCVCKICHEEFQTKRGKGQDRRVYCDKHLAHSKYWRRKGIKPTTEDRVEITCKDCGKTLFVPLSIGHKRKLCEGCAYAKTNPKDIGGIMPNVATTTRDILDDAQTEAEQELNYLLYVIERDGIIWGKSATNGPHQRDLYVRLTKAGPVGLLESIKYAKPLIDLPAGITLEQAIPLVRQAPAWQIHNH